MSFPKVVPPANPTGVAVHPRPTPGARLRNVLHLLMVLSLWLSTVSPLLVPAQPALADTVDWSTRNVTLPPAEAARPPYRAGVKPPPQSSLSAPDTLAETPVVRAASTGYYFLRHPELVSGYISPRRPKLCGAARPHGLVAFLRSGQTARWTLKQVQGDEKWRGAL